MAKNDLVRKPVLSIAIGAVVLLGATACGGSKPIAVGATTIVFASGRDTDFALFLTNVGTSPGRAERLTKNPHPVKWESGVVFQSDAAWAPDGTRIAFTSNRTGRYRLYVMVADGTGERLVPTALPNIRQPAWSPDGKSIALVAGDPTLNTDLYVLDLGSGRSRRLTRTPVDESSPSWSPDGERIAYSRRKVNATATTLHGDVYVVPATGGSSRNVTATPAVDDLSPAWSPDGAWIAFTSITGNQTRLEVIRPDGTGRRVVAHGLALTDPSWSPDSQRIAFSSSIGLEVIGVDGKGLTQITDEIDIDPAWRPR